MMNRIAIYAEQCLRAGRQCWDEDEIENPSADVVIYEGTDEEIIAQASAIDAACDADSAARPGAANAYRRREARTLREAVGA